MTAPPDRHAAAQSDFVDALLDPTRAPPADLSPTAEGRAPEKRFAVYRNNVVHSLAQALGAAYPTVKRLVGDELFDAMAALHVRAHPPRSPVMLLYGEAFPAWLDGFKPAVERAPYLADVARLERARREAYHAEDADPLGADAFGRAAAAVPAEAQDRIGLTLHPSLRLVASRYPVVSIWARANGESAGDGPLSGAETAMILRPRDALAMRAVSPGAEAFLRALGRGETLGDAAEAGAQAEPGFDLAAAISGAVATGAVINLSSPGGVTNR